MSLICDFNSGFASSPDMVSTTAPYPISCFLCLQLLHQNYTSDVPVDIHIDPEGISNRLASPRQPRNTRLSFQPHMDLAHCSGFSVPRGWFSRLCRVRRLDTFDPDCRRSLTSPREVVTPGICQGGAMGRCSEVRPKL